MKKLSRYTPAVLPLLIALLFLPCRSHAAEAFRISEGKELKVNFNPGESEPVKTALGILQNDLLAVLGSGIVVTGEGNSDIIAGTLGVNPAIEQTGADLSALKGLHEGFLLQTLPSGKLLIAGSDSHGTIYGLMELSRMLGVSPWEWWADAAPRHKDFFEIPAGYSTLQHPSVDYRGIFINDEDWGLMPWSGTTFEPECGLHTIGPRTTEKIFELLTRLRANTYWPPMHECSHPFFLTKGNREAARRYGIYIGGSHCEPMASSTAVEWQLRGKGEYDFVNNRSGVVDFWEERLKEVAGQEIIYTVGMRGVHDSGMQGAASVEERKAALTEVLKAQRSMLSRYNGTSADSVPQVFIPYKEVLEVYEAGLEVPDDVTLMWCDDNYGYIRHLPTQAERSRRGGNGIYYHLSYWGRPHDYLWLGTFSPFLLRQQMEEAYRSGIQKMWILNVGDIKPAEYQTELFMDMAWNIDSVTSRGVERHMLDFLSREFGDSAASRLLPAMKEHYRLAFIRKPEFMGGTRTEEVDRKYWSTVHDLPFTTDEIRLRLQSYDSVSAVAEEVWRDIPADRRDTYFQLVKYPLQSASQMNRKLLSAQLARHGMAPWEESDAAYDSIQALTSRYDAGFGNRGKWHKMMHAAPRGLAVFGRVPRQETDTMPYPFSDRRIATLNAADITDAGPLCEGLGYEGKAAALGKMRSVAVDLPQGTAEVELCFIPTHPEAEVAGLRVEVAADGDAPLTINYATKERSEEWKTNVLSNRASRRIPVSAGARRLTLRALDGGVILDQIIFR